MNVQFEILRDKDFEFISEIYDYYVRNTTATYYTEKVSIEELKGFIPLGDKKYKSFLIRMDGQDAGFCYLSRFNKRQAYDRTAEVSLYLRQGMTGKGIGYQALQFMEKVALDNGISVLVGIISGDNAASIGLFEKCGYVQCARYRQVGEKFGRLLDVVACEKIISP